MSTSNIRRLRRFGSLSILALVTGCAGYSPASLPTGASEADIMAKMGRPTGEYVMPDGHRRLEYAKGPMGVQTFMLDLNAKGELASWDQVLTERKFSEVTPGLTKDEVLHMLGRPSEIKGSQLMKLTYWNYRYDNFMCQMFSVDIDRTGKVTAAGYTPDFMCIEPNDMPLQ